MLRYTSKTLSNKMLILSEADVRRCFPVSAAISANRKALSLLRKDGGAMVPTRIGLPYHAPPNGSINTDASASEDWSLFKPAAYYPPPQNIHTTTTDEDHDDILMGMKLISLRSNNPSKFNKPTGPATIMLLNAETGEVSAIVAATYLTAMRTAAGSALSTELALKKSNHDNKRTEGYTLVVFGAGLQAEMHIKCIRYLVNINKLVIVNRSSGRAEKLKQMILNDKEPDSQSKAATPITNISIVLLSNEAEVKDAVFGADVIATTTNSCTPLFRGEWLKPGCHINGVGSYTAKMKEVPDEAVKRCEVLIDTHEALDVGDLQCITNESPNLAGLIGDALVGNIEFGSSRRRDGINCTFFKSVGTAIQDVVSADVAVTYAIDNNIGVTVDM